jgi:hypothetical protein
MSLSAKVAAHPNGVQQWFSNAYGSISSGVKVCYQKLVELLTTLGKWLARAGSATADQMSKWFAIAKNYVITHPEAVKTGLVVTAVAVLTAVGVYALVKAFQGQDSKNVPAKT